MSCCTTVSVLGGLIRASKSCSNADGKGDLAAAGRESRKRGACSLRARGVVLRPGSCKAAADTVREALYLCAGLRS